MAIRKRMIHVGLVLGLAWSTGTQTRAAEADLAKILPGPSVLYLGWCGAEAAGPAYDETAFGRLMAEPEFVQLREALGPQLNAVLKQLLADMGSGDLYEPLREILRIMHRRPGAINVMRVALMRQGIEVQAAVVWQLGPDADRFEGLVKPLLAGLFGGTSSASPKLKSVQIGEFAMTQYSPGGPLPALTWGRVGQHYIVTAGTQTPKMIVNALTGKSEKEPLVKHEVFAAARKGLGAEAGTTALNWYLSIDEINRRLPFAFTVIDMQRPKGRRKTGRLPLGILVPRTMRALGTKKIRALAGSVSMEGNRFRIAWYLHAPGAKGGLLRIFQQAPITDADLAVVPRDTNFFYATNLDLHGFYQEMMSVFEKVDPNTHKEWVNLLAVAEDAADVKLVDDVLAPLDDGWILYNAPSSGGVLGTGLTLVAEAKDTAHAERTLAKLAQSLVDHIGGAQARVAACKTPGGKTVRFIDLDVDEPWAAVAPAWAAVGKHLVIAAYPQIVASAVDRLAAGGDKLAAGSILKRPDFASRRKLLPDGANAIGYLDAADLLGGLYRVSLPAVSAARGELAKVGIDLDISLWPRAETVERHLFGMVSGLAASDQGVLVVSNGPLPIPMPTARSAALILGAATVGLSGTTDAGQAAFDDLRAVGLGCHRYAVHHGEKFPPKLDALVSEKLVASGGRWLMGYGYVSGLTPYDPPWCVLAYDASALTDGAKRIRVLPVTGKCTWMTAGDLSGALDKTRKHVADKPKTTSTAGGKAQ